MSKVHRQKMKLHVGNQRRRLLLSKRKKNLGSLYVQLLIYMHQTFPFAKCQEKSRTFTWCWARVVVTVTIVC